MAEYKGNLIEFNLIKSKVNQISENEKVNERQRSLDFLTLCLMEYLDIDQYTAEESIVDGSDDCGVDAVYFATDDNDNPEVYIFQSKYYQSSDKLTRNFEGAAIDKLLCAVDTLFLQPFKGRSYTNHLLREKLESFHGLYKDSVPKFNIIFCSNSYPPSEKDKQKINDWVDAHSHGNDIFKVAYLHLKEISELIAPDQRKNISDKLHLSGTWSNYESGNARSISGRVSISELARLYEKHGEYLFDKNVRTYLRSTNLVNEKIRKTLTGPKSHDFFYLNNGITIVCNKLNYLPGENPTVEMQSLQIVNGSQTTHTIYEVLAEGAVHNKDYVFVLAKIIETEDSDLLASITEATNSQTAVTSKDLRSNDPVQRIIEEQLRTMGYYYEARTNKYLNDKDVKPDRRIDSAIAGQVWLAFHLQRPYDASKKAKVFMEFYHEVFPDNIDVRGYLDAYLLFKHIHKIGKNNREQYPFASYAKFHIMAMMKRLNVLTVKAFEENESKYFKLMDAIKVLVSTAQNKSSFTGYGAYFNQGPSLLEKIDKAYKIKNQ